MSSSASSGGIGCVTLLGIALIILKVLAVDPVASWSWWIVLLPFILQAAVIAIALFVVLLWVRFAATRSGR